MAVTSGYTGKIMLGAAKVLEVMNASCDVTWNTEDITAFDPDNTYNHFQQNAATVKSVSGSFEANLDYSDTTGQRLLIQELFGSGTAGDGTVALKFYPYDTSFGLSGNAIISFSINSAASSIAKVTYNFTGTGAWTVVTS